MANITLKELNEELSGSYENKSLKLNHAFSLWLENKQIEDSEMITVNENYIYYANKNGDIRRAEYLIEGSIIIFSEDDSVDINMEETLESRDAALEVVVDALSNEDYEKADKMWNEANEIDKLIEGTQKKIRGGVVVKVNSRDTKKKKKGFVVRGGKRRKQSATEKASKKLQGKKLGRSSSAKIARKKSMKLRKRLNLSHNEDLDVSDDELNEAFKRVAASKKKSRKKSMAKLNKTKKGKKGFKRIRSKSGGVKLVKLSAKEKASKKKIGKKLSKGTKMFRAHNEDENVVDLNKAIVEEVNSKVMTSSDIVENLMEAISTGESFILENRSLIVEALENKEGFELPKDLLKEESLVVMSKSEIDEAVSVSLALEGVMDESKIEVAVDALYLESREKFSKEIDGLVSDIAKHVKDSRLTEEASNIISESSYSEKLENFLDSFIAESVDDAKQLQFTLDIVNDILEAITEEDEVEFEDLKVEFESAKTDLEESLQNDSEGMDEDRFEEISEMIENVIEDEEEDEKNLEENSEWATCKSCSVLSPVFEENCIECGTVLVEVSKD